MTEKVEIEYDLISVRGERFTTFVCRRCGPTPRRGDKISGRLLLELIGTGIALRLPYMTTFHSFGHGTFGLLGCVCEFEKGLRSDGSFICDYESGTGGLEDHDDRVLLNRFSGLTSFASILITLEHESAHGAGVAHDEEMVAIERFARDRIARQIPKLPPGNVMMNTNDSYRPRCPRAGERKVLAEILAASPYRPRQRTTSQPP